MGLVMKARGLWSGTFATYRPGKGPTGLLRARVGGMLTLVTCVSWAALSRDEHVAISTTRDAMCRGVVREMHTEIHKHSLKKNGEDDIYETVPAICLAIVQNYTLTKTAAPSSSWSLLKRAKKLDDEEGGMPDPESFKHIMTLKKAPRPRRVHTAHASTTRYTSACVALPAVGAGGTGRSCSVQRVRIY